jgi:hypothetical protein
VVKDGVSVSTDGVGNGNGVFRECDGLNVATVDMSISSTVDARVVSPARVLSSLGDSRTSLDVSTVVDLLMATVACLVCITVGMSDTTTVDTSSLATVGTSGILDGKAGL